MKLVEVINITLVFTTCLLMHTSCANYINIVLVELLYILFCTIFVDEKYEFGYLLSICPLFLVSVVTKCELSLETIIMCCVIMLSCKFRLFSIEKTTYDHVNFCFGTFLLFIQIQDKLIDVKVNWLIFFLFVNVFLCYSKALEYCSSFEVSALLTALHAIIYDLVCNFFPVSDNTNALKVIEIGILSLTTLFIVTSKLNRDKVELFLAIMVLIIMFAYMYISHVLDCDFILWTLKLVFSKQLQFFYICIYWIICIILSVLISLVLFSHEVKQICIRKIFHIAVVIMFTPVILMENTETFLILALGAALCGFLIIEYCRIYLRTIFPIMSTHISYYYGMLIDSRDKNNKFIVSHIYLLLSIAFPIWISHALFLLDRDIDKKMLILFPYIGIITVGVGDTFGAIVGSSFGSILWFRGTKRTIEGSSAMFTTMISFLLMLILITDKSFLSYSMVGKMIVLSFVVTIVEALTEDNDNIMLPLVGSIILLIEFICSEWKLG